MLEKIFEEIIYNVSLTDLQREQVKQILHKYKSQEQKWISVEERLPEERESIFSKFKGTDKWSIGMFEKCSENVCVVCELEDGKVITSFSHTTDGKWTIEKERSVKYKVIAWMPIPEYHFAEADKKVGEAQ